MDDNIAELDRHRTKYDEQGRKLTLFRIKEMREGAAFERRIWALDFEQASDIFDEARKMFEAGQKEG